MNESNFKPLRALVFVRRDEPQSEIGGIVIPDSWRMYGWRATVIRSGSDAQEYKEGDTILFLKEFTVLPFKDRTLAITDAKHILAKLETVSRHDGSRVECIIPQNDYVMVESDKIIGAKGEIYLPDKAKDVPKTGIVHRVGRECHDARVAHRVWYDAHTGVSCVEDDKTFRLIKESNIIAMGV